MPEWKPEPIWKGEDAFIIGGGTSLREFDWDLLRDENTIGCNSAFRLGVEICKICVFVDRKWLFDAPNHPRKGYHDELAKFPGLVITNDTQLKGRPEPWINWMQRRPRGLHHDSLGYNANCGATAINVALLLGATTIYLLGIDMHLDDNKKPNWHNYVIDKASKDVYARMLAAFGHVSKDLALKFPDCKVLNINKDSALRLFPILDPDIFWAERKEHGRVANTSGTDGGNFGTVDTSVDAVAEKSAIRC